MAHRETIKKYHLIINFLRKNPKSYDEIKSYVKNEFDILGYKFQFSTRTFQRDLKNIETIFDIEIKYSRSLQKYRILYDEKDPRTERVIEAYDIANTLNVGSDFLQYINFENRMSLGTHLILDCLVAIKNKKVITIIYRKYSEEDYIERALEPYILKEYKQRWYLVAKDDQDHKIKIYGLDRILTLTITNKVFEYPNNFSSEGFFKYKYGVMFSEKEPQNIELSFGIATGKYVKSSPLHHSQKILIDNNQEFRISLKLAITLDFKRDLLRFADEIQVIKPKSLAEELKKIHFKSSK